MNDDDNKLTEKQLYILFVIEKLRLGIFIKFIIPKDLPVSPILVKS